MSAGYPDYFGQQIFESFGPLKHIDESGTLDSWDSVLACRITKRGRTYGGYVLIDFANCTSYPQVVVYVNSDGAFDFRLDYCIQWGFYHSKHLPLTLTYLDMINGKMCLEIGRSITFTSDMSIYILNTDDVQSIDYRAKLTYQEVTY